MRKVPILLVFFSGIAYAVRAQTPRDTLWWSPAGTNETSIGGRAWTTDTANRFGRLSDSARGRVRNEVFGLGENTAGVTLHFSSDAASLTVEYRVKDERQFPHMAATGVSGIDLYQADGHRLAGRYRFGDTVRYDYERIAPGSRAYTLYLPLYNRIAWLRIGCPAPGSLKPVPASSPNPPIVVYGTSIAQGACASRSGLAWTAILARKTGCPVINLGFSGNGRLEPAVIDQVNQIDAAVFVLDCLPNLTADSPVVLTQKIVAAVGKIRRAHPEAPIVLAEHAGFSNESTDSVNAQTCRRVNDALRNALAGLTADGERNVYVLAKTEIGLDEDCWVDQVHPNDLGMARYAGAYIGLLRKIDRLKKYILSKD